MLGIDTRDGAYFLFLQSLTCMNIFCSSCNIIMHIFLYYRLTVVHPLLREGHFLSGLQICLRLLKYSECCPHCDLLGHTKVGGREEGGGRGRGREGREGGEEGGREKGEGGRKHLHSLVVAKNK